MTARPSAEGECDSYTCGGTTYPITGALGHIRELHALLAESREREERLREDFLALEARHRCLFGTLKAIEKPPEFHLRPGHDCYEQMDDDEHRVDGSLSHDVWLANFYARGPDGAMSAEARRALSKKGED